MPVARPEKNDARVIAHVDLDCFYVQVEQRRKPELHGKPAAVVQYNSWKGGGLIAVGYEARNFGVKRSMRGDEAKKVCPDIQLIQVPVCRGKADLNIYRDAGSEVVSVLATKGKCERASIDEVYLDITDVASNLLSEKRLQIRGQLTDEVLRTHILGLSQDTDNHKELVRDWLSNEDADYKDQMLACGAIIVAELRLEVLSKTQFTCSAGIAHNKMLAKLASGMHKPAQQTLVPAASVPSLLSTLPVKKMKQLGGKLGSSLEENLGIKVVGELLQFSESKLQELYGANTGTWLWNIARGINGDEVKGRLLPKSQGCGKTFPGSRALKNMTAVNHWLSELSEELNERIQADLEQNNRIAHQLTLHVRAYEEKNSTSQRKFPSKSCTLRYGKGKILQDSLVLFERGLREYCEGFNEERKNKSYSWAVAGLSIIASNIFSPPTGVNSIIRFFTCPNIAARTSADLDLCAPLYNDENEEVSLHSNDNVAEESAKSLNSDMENCLGISSDAPDENMNCNDSSTKLFLSSAAALEASSRKKSPELFTAPEKLMSDHYSNSSSIWISNRGQSDIQQLTPSKCDSHGSAVEDSMSCGGSVSQVGSDECLAKRFASPSSRNTRNSIKTKKDKSVGILKLEDMWKNTGTIFESATQNKITDNWFYKPDDIDESIVKELPEEIQEEIHSMYRCKRPRTEKRIQIGDYFKSSSNPQRDT